MITLKNQLAEAMKNKCAFAEYLIKDNDYLLVHCDYNELHNGIEIIADFEKTTYFSGEVVELDHGGFVLPFDPDYFDNIDHYLEQCSDEILEGYLLPNDLLCEDA